MSVPIDAEVRVKKRFIDELSEGELVQDVFLVKQSLLKTSRSGSLYMDMTLADKSGTVNAKLWDASRQLHESFEADDFILVRANVESYMGRPQLVISHVKKAEEEKIDLADFLPASERDPDEMQKELQGLIGEVKDPALSALLKAFFDDKEFAKSFARCPAAVSLHHAFLGGLLEHTVAVARMAVETAGRYPLLDRDMLIAGALLHDIGKVEEIEHARAFKYSDRGQLLGHLVMGASEIEERAAKLKDFPQETLTRLQHLILSHHGQYEFGSPKLPMTAEAMALHYLDNLDAKMQAFREAQPVDGSWTDWSRMFERRLYLPQDREESK
jgi:3'-5' exoribonuclease